MEEMPDIGVVIRQQRQRMQLSLDEAARRTGVSKAMLGQIERGESSPTISTLWKISSGLKLTFSELMERREGEYRAKRLCDVNMVREAGGLMRLYDVFPFDPQAGFECFYIELEPGCDYPSPGHANVKEEYIMVTSGTLTLTIEGEAYEMPAGSSISFFGGAAHTYANRGGQTTAFQNIIRY